MTLDQVYLLVCDEDELKQRRFATKSPAELVQDGVIAELPGGARSYVQMIRAQKAAKQKAEARENRKRRKAEERQRAIDYKNRQNPE